ncbi:MAG: hypothetical protein FJW84_04090 [Actinobacteria bacterium]|nr:hypothetical protein [Actinomycetota bacterium]
MKYTILIIGLLMANIGNAEIKLGWESKGQKTNEWTRVTVESVNRHFQKLNVAEDTELFCPEYTFLPDETKKHFWAEFVSSMAFYESGWNPMSQLTEISLGTDSVTGRVVTSEGLLQLSYGDIKWATWCHFDWESDNKNNPVVTTILDPKNNLECGIGILANQIRKHHRIVLEKRAYWSILKVKHRFERIDPMRKMITSRMSQCSKQK